MPCKSRNRYKTENDWFFVLCQKTGDLPHFPWPVHVGEEIRRSSEYRQEGRYRPGERWCVFQFTLKGRGTFHDRHGEHPVQQGSGFLCEANDPSTAYYYPPDARDPWHFIYIGFTGEVAHQMTRDLVRRFGGIYELPLDHSVIQRLRAFKLHNGAILTLADGEAMRLVTDVFHALAASKTALNEQHPDHVRVRRAREIILARIDQRLTTRELAAQLQVSREHFSRVFTEQTGLSPSRYILRTKLLRACSLLQGGTLAIKEIASRLGYDSSAHFIRAFRRGLQITPTEFRNADSMPAVLAAMKW